MANLKDIVRGLEEVQVKRFEDTRFMNDVVYPDDIEVWINETIGQKGNLVSLADDNILALVDDVAFIIREQKSIYMGETQLSYSVQELTLKGVSYFAKEILIFDEPQKMALNDYYNTVLSERYYIEANSQDLGGIAELNTVWNRYILHTKLERGEYWLTFELFEGFYLLTKVTHKQRRVPVKLKGIKVPIL